MANISFYGSHNSAVAVEQDGKLICVIEVERFLNVKNAGYAQYLVSHTRPFLLKEICKWIEKNMVFQNLKIVITLTPIRLKDQQKSFMKD